MDRTLVLSAQVAIAQGHRVEVSEQLDPLTETPVVVGLVDLDTGVAYRRAEEAHGETVRWLGRVLDCTIVFGGAGAHTTLRIDPIGPGSSGARVALRGADAAADAAKAEADRWGGSDHIPAEETERFW